MLVSAVRQLQQSWNIKRGLCYISAPQNYLIVDFQSTRRCEEGGFANYVTTDSDISAMKQRFLQILRNVKLAMNFRLHLHYVYWHSLAFYTNI